MLGGAFDPPHVGHAIVAQDVREALELDRLLIVPTASPPHRATVLPADLRLELVRTLFEGAPGLEVSDIEYRMEGPSYTVRTLERLREEESPAVLYCVIGVDQLRVIESWHEHDRLPEVASVVVMTRAGREPRSADAVAPIPYLETEVTRIDVSGTRIRERLRAGRSIRFLVPEALRLRVEEAWAEAAG